MVASFLERSLGSVNTTIRLKHVRKFSNQKRNQNFLKPLMGSICLLICIAFVPERPTHLASICEKYNSADACKVW